MAYHGYYTLMKMVLQDLPQPRVLEIGVDKGQTLIPLLHFLSVTKENFILAGCDILFREEFTIQVSHIKSNLGKNQNFGLYTESSLDLLPRLVEEYSEHLKTSLGKREGIFNMILIDGDHNYYTVKKELEHTAKLLSEYGIIVFDDYYGRWSEQDEYFSEFEEYKKRDLGTPNQNTEKKGVKPAVDEFLQENPEWEMNHLIPAYEPVLLYRKGYWTFESHETEVKEHNDGGTTELTGITITPGPKLIEIMSQIGSI